MKQSEVLGHFPKSTPNSSLYLSLCEANSLSAEMKALYYIPIENEKNAIIVQVLQKADIKMELSGKNSVRRNVCVERRKMSKELEKVKKHQFSIQG